MAHRIRSRHVRVPASRAPFPKAVIWGLGGAFALGILLTAALVYNTVRNVFAIWDGSGLPPLFQSSGGDETPAAPGSTPTAMSLDATPMPWNGTDRVTILAMGLDYRDWEADESAPRTDTMMLVTVDPVSRTVGVLSIPRDLWVDIPGFEHNRINTAYSLGENYDYPGDAAHPGGGPGLAMVTVEELLGVPIQYYALIEFAAFERVVDEIGGIDVLVPEPMRIHPIGRRYGIDLEAKAYHFDGAQALAYARARRTESGDFGRSQRQQQVIMAIRDRVLGFDMIPTLVLRAPALYQEISAGVHTNLNLEQMIGLGLLVSQIPPENIRRGVIGPPDMVLLETMPDGAEVLRPVPDQIRILRDEIFTITGAIGPSVTIDNPPDAAGLEGARVAVRNGAGIEGIATRAADFLREQGINVVEVGNADRMDYEKTVVIDYTGNPYTTRFLMSLLNLTQSQILSQTIPDSPVDVAVIVGPDIWLP